MSRAPKAADRARDASVLPTPASPSSNTGRLKFTAQASAVASPASAMYPALLRRCCSSATSTVPSRKKSLGNTLAYSLLPYRLENPSMHTVDLIVNGKRTTLEVEPRVLLVQALRDQLGLTGTHVGCDTSSCGACTVLLDGVSVKSCTV